MKEADCWEEVVMDKSDRGPFLGIGSLDDEIPFPTKSRDSKAETRDSTWNATMRETTADMNRLDFSFAQDSIVG